MPREKIKFALRMSPETQQLVRVPFGDMGKKRTSHADGRPFVSDSIGSLFEWRDRKSVV